MTKLDIWVNAQTREENLNDQQKRKYTYLHVQSEQRKIRKQDTKFIPILLAKL